MTAIRLKEHGTYLGFSEKYRAYLYKLNNKIYTINGKGINTLGVFNV